ncbi:phosphocholine cytidylyltransferase family protein [Thalassospira lucentensis]|uniref:phosphocholine cytidylyltransferase family protein n=1 Tax=Thalassospira lucentensis TaxID=168935 RepID=UPI0003B560AF|nr:phosphocholine cytidylyltransferase family protein [Thalassospira lucentensis]RCK18820.1 hypothetical protein TH1_22180 [Thalassospira lucentensis MCCC 1A00383 = DSM 14000]
MTAAIILAAGRGSRLGDLTSCRPKCLTELNGRSLLSRQISALREAGIYQIAIVTGYKGELLHSAGLPCFYNSDWETTGIFTSLSRANEWLRCGAVIVSYGDIFYSSKTITALKKQKGPLALTYDPNWYELWSKRSSTPLDDAESFVLDDKGRVKSIGKKIASHVQAHGQYMGLMRMSPMGWKQIREAAQTLGSSIRKADMTTVVSVAIEMGMPVTAIPCIGKWGEVDTVEDVNLYQSKEFMLDD